MVEACRGLDLAELFITSSVKIDVGGELSISILLATGEKCQRCWNIRSSINDADLCNRCEEVLASS
ncbi:MAG: zinc finger domain-containing protein, partial [Alphaproteobacteria bacterium]